MTDPRKKPRPLLDRRPQRVEGVGKVTDIVEGPLNDCLGEGARMTRVASEHHDARIKVLS